MKDDIECYLQRYQNDHNIAPKGLFIDLNQLDVRAVVRRTADVLSVTRAPVS